MPFRPGPAQYRACALDTHEALPPYDFKAPVSTAYKTRLQPTVKGTINVCQQPRQAPGPKDDMPTTELTDLQAMRLKTVHDSEWALLDTHEARVMAHGHLQAALDLHCTC